MSDSESEEITSKPLSSDNLETKGTSEHFVQLETQHEDHCVTGEQKRALPRNLHAIAEGEEPTT